MAAFSFKDHIVKLVSSAADGTTLAEKRLFSGNKGGIEPGPKATVMKGYSMLPFDIIYNSAEPKWTLDGMSAPEVQDAIEFVGRLGGPFFSIIVIVQRSGVLTRHLKIVAAAIGEGGDWTFDEGSGATGKLGGPMKNVLFAKGTNPLRSIFASQP